MVSRQGLPYNFKVSALPAPCAPAAEFLPPIKDSSGKLVTDKFTQANVFNDYFASVFTSDDGTAPNFPRRAKPTISCSNVSFTPAKVARVLKGLKSKNSYGPDGFSNVLLKKLANALSEPLAFIFDASFRTHVLPAPWLHALVTPVFKKGITASPSNYRPISVTCVCCRVMERIVNFELIDYLQRHGLITKCQHGFLRKHSTCTNLLESVYDWSVALNQKLKTDVVYIDFQKAFDTVSHQKLIIKLESYGVCGDLLEWLKAFLRNRTQAVNLSGHVSDIVRVTSGVPQGSVLGPTLFLVFINDIEDILFGFSVHMKLFADDAKLYSSFDCNFSCDLQDVCDRLAVWANMWQLRIAFSKCSVSRISNRDYVKPNTASHYVLGEHVLLWANVTRDLGINVDNKLNFNNHISVIVHKAHMRASLILRAFVSSDRDLLTKAYITYVRPILEYCTPVWSPHTLGNINRIESCQRWFTKRLKGLAGLGYYDRLTLLGLESLQLRRVKYDLIMFYKIVHDIVDINTEDFFHFSQYCKTRGHGSKLFKCSSRVDAHKHFFINRICDIWNCLPSNIVEASSVTTFRQLLDSFELVKFCIS